MYYWYIIYRDVINFNTAQPYRVRSIKLFKRGKRSYQLLNNSILQENGRIIQSIGSPYLGTSLAGLLALIGGWFGIGCGINDDLTYDGAERWEASIPMEKAAEVYFYTTQVRN